MPSTSGSYAELYRKYEAMKAEGKNTGNSKSAAKLLKAIQAKPEHQIIKTLTKQLIEMDKQIQELTPHLALTDEEKDAFFESAIAQIEPWYQEKVARIEESAAEGKIQTAEDTLLMMRDVEEESTNLLARWDLTRAETEEEFIDNISELTSRVGDDLTEKRLQWGQRLENVKLGQIQKGIFSSGIGAKKRAVEEQLKETELGSIERRGEEERISLERGQKYNLQQIQLSRQAAEQDRIRRIGTPEAAGELAGQARETLGLGAGEQLGGQAQIESSRVQRGISPIYAGGAQQLRDLEEDRGTRVLSRRGELIAGEEAIRKETWGAQLDKINAEQAKKARQLKSYGITY